MAIKGVVITIEGLRELFKKKADGNKITTDELELADRYMRFKEREFNDHKTCCSGCLVKRQYLEALHIVRFLHEN